MGEISWCGVNGFIAGVQEIEGAREGVAILLNDVWHRSGTDFGCVSFRTLWAKFKFSRVKVFMVVVNGPTEGDVEERERLWNDLDRVIDRIGNGYKLCVLGYLNRWVGERMKEGITGWFGVPGEIDTGRRVIDFPAEREL